MEKWKVDFDKIRGRVSIKEDTYNQKPIAQVLTPVGDWMKNPTWVKAALDKANMIAAVPELKSVLQEFIEAVNMPVLDPPDWFDNVSEIANKAKQIILKADGQTTSYK